MSNYKLKSPLDHTLFPGTEVIDVIEAVLTPEELKGFYKGSALVHRLCAGDIGPAEESIDTAHWYQDQLCVNNEVSEDMADPRNWRKGDWLECVDATGITLRVGELCRVNEVYKKRVLVDYSSLYAGSHTHKRFRFHARPDADGWIKWDGVTIPKLAKGSLIDWRGSGKDLEPRVFFGAQYDDFMWRGSRTVTHYRPHLAS